MSHKIIIPKSKKPRAKELNEVLMSRPGGKMKNPKDISRAKNKQELKKLLDENNE